jgi:hypothetical protein
LIKIFDNDEDIMKYLFDFYDEQHFVETEEGEEPIPIEKLIHDDCQAAMVFSQVQEARNCTSFSKVEQFNKIHISDLAPDC